MRNLAKTMITNTDDPECTGKKSGAFWDVAEASLLMALVLYVVMVLPDSQRRISSLRYLTGLKAVELDNLFDALSERHPARMEYNTFKQAGEKLRGSILIGLGARFHL